MGDEWHEWLGSLNHGDDCDTTMDLIEQMALDLIAWQVETREG